MKEGKKVGRKEGRKIFHREIEVWIVREKPLKMCISDFKDQKCPNIKALYFKPPQPNPTLCN
jgi:hypothetical protein